MNALKPFKIPFVGMKNKVHLLDFKVDKLFFQCFENALITDCDVDIKIEFDKRESFFHLKFYIDGQINLECHRCLERYNQPIFGDYELFIKASAPRENTGVEDVIYISPTDDFVDISKAVYDYILLSVPLHQVHADLEDGTAGCSIEMNNEKENSKEESIDPRWAALQNLKNKK